MKLAATPAVASFCIATGARRRRLALPSPEPLAYSRTMAVPLDDSALMLRYADGDSAAFETLYRRHNDGLYRYLLRLSNNRDTAADLFQEVWSKLIDARKRYRPSAKFSTYLYRIAHNAFIDHIRRNKRYGDGPPDDPDQRASGEAGPELHAEESLTRARFLRALQHLPDEQRDAFLLYQEAGLKIDEIATVVGAPRETVKSRVRYATNKLRNALTEARPDKNAQSPVKSMP